MVIIYGKKSVFLRGQFFSVFFTRNDPFVLVFGTPSACGDLLCLYLSLYLYFWSVQLIPSDPMQCLWQFPVFYSDWLPFNLLYLYFAFGHCTCICICIFVRQSRVQVSLCLWPFPPAMLLLVQALSTKVKCPHTLGIPVFVFVFYLCLSMFLCFLFIFVFAFCICNKQSFTSPRPPGVHQGRVSAHIGQQCCPLFDRFVQPTFLPVLSIEAFL